MALASAAPRIPAPKVPSSLSITDILGPMAGYNAVTGTPLPGSAATPAPFTTPAAPAGSGGTFNYTDLLKNDTLLNNTLSGLSAQGVADQAALRAGQQKAVIGFGQVPSAILADPTVASAIDQTTRDLAQQNTQAGLSTAAKLKQAYDQATQAHVADEAARGMLRSGAYGQHSAEDLLGYNQAQDTATSQLLDYLNGLYTGYLQQQQALQGQATAASGDALNRIINEITAGLISGGSVNGGGNTTPAPAPPPPVSPSLPVEYVPGTIVRPGQRFAA